MYRVYKNIKKDINRIQTTSILPNKIDLKPWGMITNWIVTHGPKIVWECSIDSYLHTLVLVCVCVCAYELQIIDKMRACVYVMLFTSRVIY